MNTAVLSSVRGLRRLGQETRRSVFDRFRLVLAGVFLVGAALALAVAWYFSNAAANETYDRLLISAAVQMAETVGVEQTHVLAMPPDAAFETLALAKDDRVFYAVRDPQGQLVTGDRFLPTPSAATGLDGPRLHDGRVAGAAVRIATVGRYVTTAAGGGWVSIVVAQTRFARNALARSLMVKIGGLIVFVSGLGFTAALAAARRALLPLARIEHALADRGANDVTPLEVASPRETQALVDAINLVMARFADRMAKLQAFVGFSAHQIRTALAALIAQVELLESDPTSAARRVRAERVRDRLLDLGRFTNQLLGHAMIVYRAEAIPHGPVDLTEVARAALRDGVPLALDRDITVTLSGEPGPLIVRGDDVSLREALTNLVNNAVVHGAPSRLEVSVGAEGERAFVRVFDDGLGIPEPHWEQTLTPFASPRTGRPGAGLGLSIAQEIAVGHGGDLAFGHVPGGGFEVYLRLPLPARL